jgi:hypothetical protein
MNFITRISLCLALAACLLGSARAEVTLLVGQAVLPATYSLVTSNSVNGDFSGGGFTILPRADLTYTITLTPPSTWATNYFGNSNVVVLTALSDGVNPYTTIAPLTNTLTLNGTNVISQRFFWSNTNLIGASLAKVTGVTTTSTNGCGVSVGYAITGINH